MPVMHTSPVTTKLHVIQIAPCYVDLSAESGGVANVVRQLCLRLRRKGHSVTLICSNTELGKVVARPTVFTSPEGVTVHLVRQHTNTLTGPFHEVTAALRTAIFDGNAPVVAHVHTCFSMFTESAMWFLARQQIPYVFSPHGKLSPNMFGNFHVAKSWWWRLIAQRRVLGADAIGILAEAEKALFPKLGISEKVTTVPNGFGQAPNENHLNAQPSSKYIIFLGYIDPRKQPDFLVRAFAISKTSITHKLFIVGPDSYNYGKVVQETSRALQVDEKVVFIGPAYGVEKWKLLREAACLCLPSLGEGHPIVLCEALGAGLPSIYSKHCNFPEISENNAGIQLDTFCEKAWADAIDEVALDAQTRKKMGKSALDLSNFYTWDAAVDKWEALYSSCSDRLKF